MNHNGNPELPPWVARAQSASRRDILRDRLRRRSHRLELRRFNAEQKYRHFAKRRIRGTERVGKHRPLRYASVI